MRRTRRLGTRTPGQVLRAGHSGTDPFRSLRLRLNVVNPLITWRRPGRDRVAEPSNAGPPVLTSTEVCLLGPDGAVA